jgi:hypothetical protein
VLAGAMLSAGSAGASAKRHHSPACGPANGKTLIAGRRARVYAVPKVDHRGTRNVEVPLVFGCLKPRGHPRLLGSTSSGLSSYKGRLVGLLHTDTLTIRAPWTAYASSATVIDASGIGVTAVNLRTNTRRGCNVGGGVVTLAQPSVSNVVVTRSGTIAWAGVTRPERNWNEPMVNVVARCGEDLGFEVLDSGPGIELHSLALHGSTLTWTDEGETHSAALH